MEGVKQTEILRGRHRLGVRQTKILRGRDR